MEGLSARASALENERLRVRVVIPGPLSKWFSRRQPVLSPKVEAAFFRVPRSESLKRIWEDFTRRWQWPTLRLFNPNRVGTPIAPNASWTLLTKRGKGTINALPDVWISFSRNAIRTIRASHRKEFPAEGILVYLGNLLEHLSQTGFHWDQERSRRPRAAELLRSLLHDEELRLVKVSGAEFNPRFMGWRIRESGRAHVSLVHSALAYVYSGRTP